MKKNRKKRNTNSYPSEKSYKSKNNISKGQTITKSNIISLRLYPKMVSNLSKKKILGKK